MPFLAVILAALALIASSGFISCFLPAGSNASQRLTVALFVTGSLAGLAGTAGAFAQPEPLALSFAWSIPLGRFSVSADPLSCLFLFIVFSVPALASVYGLEYWKQSAHRDNGRKLGLFFGLLVGGMGLVVISRDAILFLIAWEIMALAAFFALTTEDDDAEVRRVGWIYLVATHMGTLTLFVLFALWRHATGSFDLSAAQGLSPAVAGALFALTVVGFSFKAGLMPLHVWLPGAHANAPCHVSAVMSGVLIKMGIYGIVRMTGLLTCGSPWWGAALLAAGAVSAVLGIATATAQRDIKRVLAYSSIENVGIISMGIGLALLGRSFARADLVVLGLGGALLHVVNHSLFKPLLFLNSGSIIHGTHTRDTERMGGLARKMPATAFLFLAGAAAISGLPPLNGFAGEWLLYLGFFGSLSASSAPALALAGIAAVALAMTGALAVAAFVKCYGVIFLGSPRSDAGSRAHDPGVAMVAPMGALAALCCVLGLFPALLAPLLAKAVRAWSAGADGGVPLESLAPLGRITVAGLGLLALILTVFAFLKAVGRKSPAVAGITWDCGYAAPTPRMQYTGTSFAQTIVDLFSFALRPERRARKIRAAFPERTAYELEVPDTVLDRMILPSAASAVAAAKKARVFQRGQTHLYILYIAAIALALLLFGGIWGAP